MHDMFKDLKVIVTGAASGFGYAIAERLLKYAAAEVWLFDFNAFKLEEARDVLSEEFPNRVFSKHVDISVEGEVEAAIDEVYERSGRIDMLFNNAGRPMTFSTIDIAPEDFRKLSDLNYMGVLMVTLKVLPMMEKAGKGYVINAASMGGLVPLPFQAAHASTKAAVITFTRCLAYEYYGTDIQFMQYSPANVATNIFFAQEAE
ncbi:MAG: SDR family oxidoreductase [archaeon]|nr:SDR family oxidoreductase [archaeon]